ncbi:phosphatase PAP2 family protein [Candidatus Amesbacteria bacterium]|nr:phosphatase PAP2 family protein [Candidatus Amesbacteria bacterium]
MILGFGALTLGVIARWTIGLDAWATQTIQAIIPRSWDVALSVLSLVGSFEVTTILVTWAGWRLKKDLGKVALVLILYGAGMGIELAGKMFVNQVNPPAIYHRYVLPFAFPSSGVQTGNSYPSGHSFRTVFGVVLVWQLAKNRNQKIALVAYTTFMLLSRVSLGEHWMSDVIGGGLLGIILGNLGRKVPI